MIICSENADKIAKIIEEEFLKYNVKLHVTYEDYDYITRDWTGGVNAWGDDSGDWSKPYVAKRVIRYKIPFGDKYSDYELEKGKELSPKMLKNLSGWVKSDVDCRRDLGII